MVSLRKLVLEDKTKIAQLLNNKNIWDNLRNHVPFPYSEQDAINFIGFVNSNNQQEVFAIDYQEEFCGIIGLIIQEDVYAKTAEIGYWLGEPFWGKGIMTKAVELMTEYGFGNLKLVRIYTGIFEYNITSMKVLEKNGYVKEGIFKKAIYKNRKTWDEHRYCRLNST